MPETMPARTEFNLPRRALHVGDRVTTDETTSPRFGKVGTILSFERELEGSENSYLLAVVVWEDVAGRPQGLYGRGEIRSVHDQPGSGVAIQGAHHEPEEV